MLRLIVMFASAGTASYLVAGIPACARALQYACLKYEARECGSVVFLAVPGSVVAARRCQQEFDRLIPGWSVKVVDPQNFELQTEDKVYSGEALVRAKAAQRSLGDPNSAGRFRLKQFCPRHEAEGLLDDFRLAGHLIVQRTGKDSDGIVSRYINRPVSTRISRVLLQWDWIRPGHATAVTAQLGVMMALCMFAGGEPGLVAGAVLFQFASMFDGVDGEIARATQRTSARGAMLDTVTDGITNVAFIAGLASNLAQQGHFLAFEAGLAGAACLGLGCLLLAAQAKRDGDVITFDAVKKFLLRRPGPIATVLITITMRDFFAFASMIMVLGGLAPALLMVMSFAAAAWLLVVIYVINWQSGKAYRKMN